MLAIASIIIQHLGLQVRNRFRGICLLGSTLLPAGVGPVLQANAVLSGVPERDSAHYGSGAV